MAPHLFPQRDAALEQVRRIEQAKAVAFAAEVRALARLDDLYAGDDSLLLELSGTARIGQVKAAGVTDRASRLVHLFPVALGLLERGEMFVGTAQLLLGLTKNASEPVQRELDRRLSARVAPLDAVDARARISAGLVEVESELERAEQQRRHAQAKANRGVWVKPVEDGMALLGAQVDAVSAKEFVLALEELERAQAVEDARCGVVRTKAQRLADVLVELPSRHLGLLQAMRSPGGVEALLAEVYAAAGSTAPAAGAADADHTTEAADPTTEDGLPAAPADPAGPAGPAGPADPAAPVEPVDTADPELPLGLPPAGPPRPWELELGELVAGLLRLPVRRQRVLNIHVGASTVLELDEQACQVEGLGPLPGWMARTLLPDAALRRVLVDRTSGLPLHLDDTVPPLLELDLRHGPPPGSPPDAPPGPRPEPPDPPDAPSGADSASPCAGPCGAGVDEARPAAPTSDERTPDDLTPAADLAVARAWAERRRLSRVILGPATLPEPEPHYTPSARLRRLVQVRDLRCTGPGCSRPASSCDLDHELAYAQGGETAEPNLSAKSRRCHLARHHGWEVHRDGQTGVTTWTSPLGRVYTRQPAWSPPRALPADVVLGYPVPPTPSTAQPDYRHDRPLWPAPAPTPAVTHPPKPTRTGGWDDGTPPF